MDDNERRDDEVFTRQMLARLPSVAVPAALEARILADFDRVTARSGSFVRLMLGLGERLWPGVPVWQPASVLALSLAVGLMAGAVLPSPTTIATTSDTVLTALDTTTPDMDLDKDQ